MQDTEIERISSADIGGAVRITDNVWWVGHYIADEVFQCNAYLIENGEHSILIDPGGSNRTFNHVYRKITEVIPFSSIRYFVCHHQDPDITGALPLIDDHPELHPDAVIVTHWRAKELIKHYDLKMPFWEVEQHNWQLDANGRKFKFIFTPYLHFPGAFCTFDEKTGTLFSSDIFGGMTETWNLIAQDESYYQDIRPFHEHYMPSRELLMHGMMEIEKYPIELIAPQHGSIIPKKLAKFIITQLKQLECGIYAMTRDKSDIRYLSALNKAIKDISDTVILFRSFHDTVDALLKVFRRTTPVAAIEFYVAIENDEVLRLSHENRYRGTLLKTVPEFTNEALGIEKTAWFAQHECGYIKTKLPYRENSDPVGSPRHCFLIPLFAPDTGIATSMAIVWLDDDIEISVEVSHMLEQMSTALAVAVERESLYRIMDMERHSYYLRSMRDALTGLYNRYYMKETVTRLMQIQDRAKHQNVQVAMIDIDFFKQVNDTYGHGPGDDVLKAVSAAIINNTRSADIAVRLGGEEFAVFLVGDTLDDCALVAEKIRSEVEKVAFDEPLTDLNLTISVGIAIRHKQESFDDFLHRADMALYEAKQSGRNKVCEACDTY